eukprot:14882-Heterococcus_DN1.PRE.1
MLLDGRALRFDHEHNSASLNYGAISSPKGDTSWHSLAQHCYLLLHEDACKLSVLMSCTPKNVTVTNPGVTTCDFWSSPCVLNLIAFSAFFVLSAYNLSSALSWPGFLMTKDDHTQKDPAASSASKRAINEDS